MSTQKTVWQIDPLGGDVISQASPRVNGDIVCQMPTQQFRPSRDEWPERARLICAAPDLLAACELALEWSRPVAEGTRPLGWALEVQPALEAAITKATGANKPSEPEPACEPDCPTCEDEANSQSPTPDEPAPALKQFVVMTQTGERLFFLAQSVEEYDGGLGFYVGQPRWLASWPPVAGPPAGLTTMLKPIDFRSPGAEFSGSASIKLSYQEWRELLSCVQASRVVIATSTYKAIQDAYDLACQRDLFE